MLKRIRKWLKRSSEKSLETLISGGSCDSSTTITKEYALNIPAVYTAIDFISSTIAGLPVKMYRKVNNEVEEVFDDYRLSLLNSETGDLLDAYQCKKALIKDMLLDGAGYAYIDRSRNIIKGIYYVDDCYVNVIESVDVIKKSCRVYLNAQEVRDFEVFRITKDSKNGITGTGLLKTNAVLLNAMYNSLKFENTSVSSGTKRGFLQSEMKLTDEMLKALKEGWKKLYSNNSADNNDVVVLNKGVKFEPASSTATENQLNESKQTNSELIYQLFGLSSSLFDGTKGNRDAYINNIKTGVLPVIESFNIALNKFLLLEKEKDSLFFRIDTSSILRSSITDRYNAYNVALDGGWMQIDEVRRLENLAPLGMDFVKMDLGNVMYYPKENKIYTPNTNQLVDINKNPAPGG